MRQAGKRVALITNAHRDSLSLKLERIELAPYFDRLISSHDYGYPKEDARFWSALQAEIAQGVGLDVGAWAFWQTPANAKALAAPLWEDITSVMDIGIVLGALLAAGLAGRFAPNLDIPRRSLAAAVIGGLLLGYGARLAYGCNIGAYFSGIASGSLHGWLWLVAAFAGNSVGVRVLRPYFFPEERREQGLTGC
ncbi:hypothetical protein Z046_01535 [Pseudomonas aeruginosa VRFPA09]|nr:hypothetical protein Z046_01535 [Pseudomonas aeruginosa VRFPA09]